MTNTIIADNTKTELTFSNETYHARTAGQVVLKVLGLKELGTQRMYGSNGSTLLAKDWDGTVYIIRGTVNPKFTKAIKKHLPTNNATPNGVVSIKWSPMKEWAEVVDAYLVQA